MVIDVKDGSYGSMYVCLNVSHLIGCYFSVLINNYFISSSIAVRQTHPHLECSAHSILLSLSIRLFCLRRTRWRLEGIILKLTSFALLLHLCYLRLLFSVFDWCCADDVDGIVAMAYG